MADAIEPELPAMAEEILASIAREVPEYARPLEGSFGRGVRTGVAEALRQFVALIRDPASGRGPGRDVYVALGRGELRQGRTLDSLQAAYRVGARVAWRRVAAAATRAGFDAEVLSTLAEAIFAYIDELSADSVEGYARAQSEREGERQRRRRDLAVLLVGAPPAAEPEIGRAAAAAGWETPDRVAAVACAEEDLGRLARRLSMDVLAAPVRGVGCVLVPDPDARLEEIERAAGTVAAALGPAGDLAQAPESWRLARAALGAVQAPGLIRADEHLAELLLSGDRALAQRIARRRLAPLAPLTPKGRTRLEMTALEFIRQRGNAAAMAQALHVHPQTARYRLNRLRELFGDDLDDPDARFELEIALRVRGVTVP